MVKPTILYFYVCLLNMYNVPEKKTFKNIKFGLSYKL